MIIQTIILTLLAIVIGAIAVACMADWVRGL